MWVSICAIVGFVSERLGCGQCDDSIDYFESNETVSSMRYFWQVYDFFLSADLISVCVIRALLTRISCVCVNCNSGSAKTWCLPLYPLLLLR